MNEKITKKLQKKKAGSKYHEKTVAVTMDGVVLAPLRRFIARAFDYMLYIQIMTWIMALAGMYLSSLAGTLVLLVLGVALMFALEPLLLCTLGTTPGKGLLGLYVARGNGQRLKYMDGLLRMDGVMSQGAGWMIPGWSQIKMWKSYRLGEDGKPQPWDKVAPVRQRGRLSRWAVLFVLACALLAGLDSIILEYADLPGNKGDLTVEEFSENFARQSHVWNVVFSQSLDENGQWQDKETDSDASGSAARKMQVPFQYTVEDGRLTAVTISDSREGDQEPYLKLPNNQVVVAVSSYVWAQKDIPLWSDERIALVTEILRNGLGNYTLEQAGVTITCRTEAEGFEIVDGALKKIEGAEKYAASFTFTMELQDKN